MSPLQLIIEVIGHSVSILTYLAMAVYVTVRRRILRRTVRRASLIYWLVILTSVVFSLANAFRMFYLFSGNFNTAQLEAISDLLGEYLSVIAQGILILTIISLKVIAERKGKQRRILAIGAHPDDIEIACGGTLAKMRDAGYIIHGLILTSGEQGDNPEMRPNEARQGASFLGLEQVRVLRFTDTRLQDQSLDIVGAVETVIQEFQPDIILTHSNHDQHQDHQAVYEATLRAGRNQSTILCYESPSCTKEFIPSFFVDIEEHVDIKIESIREHWGQREKPYIHAERIRGIASFRGGQAKTRAAEAFELVRALSESFGEV